MSALAPERTRVAAKPQPKPQPKPQLGPAAPRLHLITRSTPEARARRAPKTPFVILLLVLLAGGLLGLLLLNTIIDQDAFTLHDLQSRQTVLDVQEAQLHETADNNADPAALAAKAAALGMIPAGPPIFVRAAKLPKGGTLVGNLDIVQGTPTPAPVAAATGTTATTVTPSAAPAAAATHAPTATATHAAVTTTARASTTPRTTSARSTTSRPTTSRSATRTRPTLARTPVRTTGTTSTAGARP